MRARKKELGDWCEHRCKNREPKCSHYPVKFVVKLMSTGRAAVPIAKEVYFEK